MTPDDIQIGDFLVTPTYGNRLDRLAGWAIRYGTDSPVNHAAIYVGDGQILEARPGGAGYTAVDAYDAAIWSTGRIDIPQDARDAVSKHQESYVGTPYGWLDILAITLAQKRLGSFVNAQAKLNKQPWWIRRIQKDNRLICSQLVDQLLAVSGYQLFSDNRVYGLVSPGDLYTRILNAGVDSTSDKG